MSKVQISEELFFKLYEYFNLCVELDGKTYQGIVKELEEKFNSLYKHYIYSKYKNQELTDEEREKARQEYLELIGLHPDFRY